MSYLVLARKHRPGIFDEVIGQDHITTLLKKAISSERVAHAYLFCGPRGIGKTSCARILAKALNCQKGPTLNPCGECSACKEIAQGSGFDVIEIDGASNRGIDEIRTLRENVKFAPSYGKYKIYIVDEVHMLTTEAFNALLKTLEEPPEHAKFIFATTEPHKLPATIISRCQRFDFKRISLKTLVESLEKICKKENYAITEDALYAIAKASQGSFRDALSILDQVSALSDRKINDGDVYSMLGLVEAELLFNLTDALQAKDCSKALEILDLIMEKGKDIKQLARDLVEHFRNLMVMKIGGKTLEKLVDYTATIKEQYFNQAQRWTLPEILNTIDELIKAQDMSRVTETLRTPLEIAFARLTYGQEKVEVKPVPIPVASVNKPSPVALAPMANPLETPAPAKFTPPQILRDNRGSATISAPSPKAPAPVVAEDTLSGEDLREFAPPTATEPADLQKINANWDALTFAVSREKMSVATYLQDGKPVALRGERLTIAFGPEHAFHKEALERKEAVFCVEKVFSEKLKSKIIIEYKMMNDIKIEKEAPTQAHEPLIQNALETFKGKIVSKWHNE